MSTAARLGAGTNPHDLDDRAAMALPDQLVTRLPDDLGARHADLAASTPGTLATVTGQRSAPFERRYFAGQLLGLLGDPRIRPDEPLMIDLPGGPTAIGTRWEAVDSVVQQWQHRGVRRDWILKECPRHWVELAPFRMMRYPVTNLEYRRFLADTGRWPAPTSWTFGVYPYERSNHPVWTVRGVDADAYTAWLSARLRRSFRLPTEQEWEYAACGGRDQEYPWGDEFRCDAANTAESGPLSSTPVGIYPNGRSPFGVEDMAGNVEEFVADDYSPYPGGPTVDDDLSLDGRRYQVTRGGSFTRFGDLTRCRRRHGWYERDIYAVGFRLVENAPE